MVGEIELAPRPQFCKSDLCLAAKKVAFTLAEVLITLGIIGVVVALTIPSLVQKYKEKVTVNKVLSAYSLLSNAYSLVLDDDGTPDTWEDKSDTGLANMFAKKMNLGRICSTTDYDNCHTSSLTPYYDLTGFEELGKFRRFGTAGQLQDMSVIFRLEAPACRGVVPYNWDNVTESSPYWHMCGSILVDINGSKLPNRYGVDLFVFIVTDRKIVPKGTPPNPYYSLWSSCNPKQTSWDGSINGDFCAAWIVKNRNMDYLYKTVNW